DALIGTAPLYCCVVPRNRSRQSYKHMNIKKRVSTPAFLCRRPSAVALLGYGLLGLLGCGLLGWNVAAQAGAYEQGLRVYQQGNYELAVQYFSEAVVERGNDPNAHYYLADS